MGREFEETIDEVRRAVGVEKVGEFIHGRGRDIALHQGEIDTGGRSSETRRQWDGHTRARCMLVVAVYEGEGASEDVVAKVEVILLARASHRSSRRRGGKAVEREPSWNSVNDLDILGLEGLEFGLQARYQGRVSCRQRHTSGFCDRGW